MCACLRLCFVNATEMCAIPFRFKRSLGSLQVEVRWPPDDRFGDPVAARNADLNSTGTVWIAMQRPYESLVGFTGAERHRPRCEYGASAGQHGACGG